jgi:transcriptional regulator with XRE-family HTH domain
VDDFRLGTAIRNVRQARGWRQIDLAERSGTSQTAVSRVERGRISSLSIGRVRTIAGTLDIRVDVVPRWRGGDLDRLVNRRHSRLHESVARTFHSRWPGWILVPEASFAMYGERGVVDILGWHPGRRSVLVIELKTDIVDVNELLGTLDRKRRLAHRVAAERGWKAASVSAWLIVADSRSNRRRLHAHEASIALALPQDRRTAERWLRDPVGTVAARSFWPDSPHTAGRQVTTSRRRVRGTKPSVAERATVSKDM